jgi:dCMP deaminase
MDKWDKRFMEMAQLVATWSSCYQDNRQIGAVIVKNKRVLTTGYNGAPSGYPSCRERGECLRRIKHIPSGTMQEFCYAIHAEQNAIVQAAKLGVSVEGATIYCTHQPCVICTKLIVNSGIIRIVYREPYPDDLSRIIVDGVGIEMVKYTE